MKFGSFEKLEKFLYDRVDFGDQHRGEEGMQMMSKVMSDLNNPQEKLKVVHVAGTSGKGSIVWYLSNLLVAHGVSVGTVVSPHMFDVRERAQIDCKPISKHEYLKYFEEFITELEFNDYFSSLGYIALLNAFAYYLFAKIGVDYAVIETGMGGRLDYTNIVEREDKIAVIGRIGFDHTHILGNSLKMIAAEKAGIVREGNLLIALKQVNEVNKVFKRVEDRAIDIKWVDVPELRVYGDLISIDFLFENMKYDRLMISSKGLWQGENVKIALTVLGCIAKRDEIKLSENIIRDVLGELKFLGRMTEIKLSNRKVILDGAHNEQKVSALISSLKEFYPGQEFDFLIAFKKGKDVKKLLKHILSVAGRVYVTDFFVGTAFEKMSSQRSEIITEILKMGHVDVVSADNIDEVIIDKSDKLLVITGSLYMLSEVIRDIGKL